MPSLGPDFRKEEFIVCMQRDKHIDLLIFRYGFIYFPAEMTCWCLADQGPVSR